MRYADEVMNLMAAYPGREWKMQHLIRYVAVQRNEQHTDRKTRLRIAKGVQRVVATLVETGSVAVDRRGYNYARYRWK